MQDVRSLLSTREGTHGRFSDTATFAQAIKNTMREAPNWRALHPVQKEALEMVATKLSRILCGDPVHPDHWADLSGYAQLAGSVCEGDK